MKDAKKVGKDYERSVAVSGKETRVRDSCNQVKMEQAEKVKDLNAALSESIGINEEGPFIEETKNLITSIAESIAQIVERDWAEIEIRKCRNKIEKLIKQAERN